MAPLRRKSGSPSQLRGAERLVFRSGRGDITKISSSKAEVFIVYPVRTSIVCPCEDSCCKKRVRVGRYGASGDGRKKCPHCGGVRQNGTYFSGPADFSRHLQTDKCRRARGMWTSVAACAEKLGPLLAYEVSNPMFRITTESAGVKESIFKCPKCSTESPWRNRYQHCVECYPKHGICLPHKISDK